MAIYRFMAGGGLLLIHLVVLFLLNNFCWKQREMFRVLVRERERPLIWFSLFWLVDVPLMNILHRAWIASCCRCSTAGGCCSPFFLVSSKLNLNSESNSRRDNIRSNLQLFFFKWATHFPVDWPPSNLLLVLDNQVLISRNYQRFNKTLWHNGPTFSSEFLFFKKIVKKKRGKINKEKFQGSSALLFRTQVYCVSLDGFYFLFPFVCRSFSFFSFSLGRRFHFPALSVLTAILSTPTKKFHKNSYANELQVTWTTREWLNWRFPRIHIKYRHKGGG